MKAKLFFAPRAYLLRAWNQRGYGIALCLGLTLVVTSCLQPRGWKLLQDPERMEWIDDGSQESLLAAVDHSIRYYARLPKQTSFQYDTLRYTAAELEASLRLFREIVSRASEPQEMHAELVKRFLFFSSIGRKGQAFFSGYYEPELIARERPEGRFSTPLYGVPQDLVLMDLRAFPGTLPFRTLAGRLRGNRLLPYDSRKQINGFSLRGRAQPLAYVDAVDLFFLQIQGSGVLRFPSDRRMKVGYAASNGHLYTSLGEVMIQRGLLQREALSMQSIRAYLRTHPAEATSLLETNSSYVFFEPRKEGPLGNIRTLLTPKRSIALDSDLFPKGGLAYVRTHLPTESEELKRPFQRFMLVQDTGGAIRGHGRGDLFFGAGAEAESLAGRMRAEGSLVLLVARKESLREYSEQNATGRVPSPAKPPQINSAAAPDK